MLHKFAVSKYFVDNIQYYITVAVAGLVTDDLSLERVFPVYIRATPPPPPNMCLHVCSACLCVLGMCPCVHSTSASLHPEYHRYFPSAYSLCNSVCACFSGCVCFSVCVYSGIQILSPSAHYPIQQEFSIGYSVYLHFFLILCYFAVSCFRRECFGNTSSIIVSVQKRTHLATKQIALWLFVRRRM